jgi:hypothetical protein
LINITKDPRTNAKYEPKVAPTKNTINEVNSTFGGRGVVCKPIQIADNNINRTRERIDRLNTSIMEGASNQINILLFNNKKPQN